MGFELHKCSRLTDIARKGPRSIQTPPPSVYLGGHCCGSHDETSRAFHLSFTTTSIQKPNSSDGLATRLHVCVRCVCVCVWCMSLCVWVMHMVCVCTCVYGVCMSLFAYVCVSVYTVIPPVTIYRQFVEKNGKFNSNVQLVVPCLPVSFQVSCQQMRSLSCQQFLDQSLYY